MSQAEALYRLQTIDLSLLQKQQRLKTIDAALNNSQLVADAQSCVNAAQQTLTPLRSKTRSLELELQTNLTKTQTTEEQLYSGRVRNPKEMQDMQHEIASLKKWHGELEDKLLTLMLDVEAAEGALADAEAQLQDAQRTHESEHSQLLKEQAALQAEVKALQAQRTEAASAVTPENLKIYTAMRPKKSNQPIAILKDRSCSVCGVEETMAIEQQVRQGHTLTYCTSCERILVYVS